ncbi:hypothetical protein PoB_005984400 [Plakobranchus ocellatus]|uniref:Uncharacterized protein n=1 Tax=Plakobranchus ocellatus TaxID=259542 RepID=A0AAV4CNC4_9GAST|nr:hypothetical protein PoB_005984400 [Plakobranchus ocellatus]
MAGVVEDSFGTMPLLCVGFHLKQKAARVPLISDEARLQAEREYLSEIMNSQEVDEPQISSSSSSSVDIALLEKMLVEKVPSESVERAVAEEVRANTDRVDAEEKTEENENGSQI